PINNNWIGVPNTNATTFKPNEGYFTFIRGSRVSNNINSAPTETVLRTKGELHQGTIGPITVMPGKMGVLANPYASPVDFTKLTTTAGIDSMYYAWDPFIYGYFGYGGYQTMSATNNWEPVPGGSPAYPVGVRNTTIQSGQAIF